MSIAEQITRLEKENELLKKKFEELKSKLTSVACDFITLNEAIEANLLLERFEVHEEQTAQEA